MADESPESHMAGQIREDLLALVAAQDLDAVPDEMEAQERFVISSIRAATRNSEVSEMCAFVYSEASGSDTIDRGFSRVAHMQDGHGEISGKIIATNQDANNGMSRLCKDPSPETIMDELEEARLADRCTVFWDPQHNVATIYRAGISSPDNHIRKPISLGDADLIREEVRSALDKTYDENLKTPSARTAKLWANSKLVERAEDELERHIKGQLTMYFVGRSRPIKIMSQTHTDVGRCDLIFIQKQPSGGPCMRGVLELKVLRGPEGKDKTDTQEGLSQGYHYQNELSLPFAILALFDVAGSPSGDLTAVLSDQPAEHLEAVLVIRYPIYRSPRAWRQATIAVVSPL